jgi:glycosyltransferase involved in cell wall biosynthesis
MYREADKVIALSEGVRKHMVKTYRLKESKVIRIYNPVDIENIKKLSMEICNIKYTKKFKLIACGRLAKQKNYSMLVNALSMLKQKDCSDFELFIMGTGPDEAEIIKLIENKGLKENIKLIGFQTNPYAYMKQADLFVLSSLWEGFGHVVVEAMACGTPVLSTDCPYGPREILENGKYGWLVPNNCSDQLAGMLEYLMFEPNEINLMSTKVCERAKSFNFTNIVQQYEIIFIKVKEE